MIYWKEIKAFLKGDQGCPGLSVYVYFDDSLQTERFLHRIRIRGKDTCMADEVANQKNRVDRSVNIKI
jgi:hypothetical protein